MSNIGEELFIC